MNILNIINEELETEKEYTLEEGLFDVSPAIALFAFKDNILDKTKTFMKKTTKPVTDAIGKVAIGSEKIKAKTIGKSGFKDDDIAYKFTKEQKEALVYIYKKYGPDMVNKITKFRNNIMVPYQIIKKSVAKNHSVSNKEIYGLTKDEYYKYRESGRKKIEAKGTFFKDAKEMKSGVNISRESLQKARKVLNDFNAGKIIDLSATNIEKILTDAGIGREKLYGWSESELEKTATKIREIEGWLNDPKRQNSDGTVRVFSTRNNKRVQNETRESLETQLKYLYEHGVSYLNNKVDDEGRRNKGSFKDAFANYLLRRDQQRQMKENMSNNKYKTLYKKVLQDAVNSAEKVYKEKINSYAGLSGKSELNKMEKKIWGLKITGLKYSGNINDWYLKIKPEDFLENTKYFDKPKEVIDAEKEIDKQLKQFERDLKKVMSDEDVALCKKYRLFNNFLTVKQFKSGSSMFKDSGDLKKLKKEVNSTEDFEELLTDAINKDYNSIKDLEEVQNKLKKAAEGKKLSNDVKSKLNDFLKRIDPKNGSEISKIDRKKLSSFIESIKEKEYTGITQANGDLNELESLVADFKEKNGNEEYSKFKYDIQEARNKINGYLSSQEE